MTPFTENDEEDDEISYYEDYSDDDGFNEDLEALRRACIITGKDPYEITAKNDVVEDETKLNQNDVVSDRNSDNSDDDDEDLELLRKIKSQLSSTEVKPLSLKPLSTLLPPESLSDEEEDDYQTLLAVRKRFASYEKNGIQEKSAELIDSSCKSVEETCDQVCGTDANERSLSLVTDNEEGQPSTPMEWNQSDSSKASSSGFPKSALAFLDAINKNRSCQKFLQSKLKQIEAKMKENNELKQRVKILRDFQAHCKRRTGEALSQKKDARVQLILTKRPRASTDSKARDRSISVMSYGPEKNADVAKYRKASTNYPLSLERRTWSEEEKKDLQKGIRQQFQEMVLRSSVDESSHSETHHGDSNDLDEIFASIKDLEISPYSIREFLPKINWEQLASMYVPGHSGGECEARWLNWEDPLINHEPWTEEEDKKILYLVMQKNGVNDWNNIAVSLGTNRTPFQCLARYQRSLNASILKGEWTKYEDAKLHSAVETFGECDWQSVASAMEGRTGTQCSNRWKKSLHPTRTRSGKWTPEEDKRLIVAQMLFGSKNWNKTAQFVPGRTQAQCRDRYVNSLEPSLRWGEWNEEEDSRLIAAIEEYGHCWSKVAACVPHRTDNMCWRRWKVLFPDEVLLLKEEKRIRKTALICNFVDREKERPALGPNDFLPRDVTAMKTITYPRKIGKRSRALKKIRPGRPRNNGQICSELPGAGNSEVETYSGDEGPKKKKTILKQRRCRRHKDNEPTGDCEAVVPVRKSTRPRRHKNNGRVCSKDVPEMSKHVVETCNEDDVPKKKKTALKLYHRRHKGSEPIGECKAIVPVTSENAAQKEPTEMSCSDRNIGTSDGDNTLASFLHKLKKRKIKAAKFAVQDSPSSYIKNPEDVRQYEPSIACDNSPGRQVVVSDQGLPFHGPMGEVSAIYAGNNHETDAPVFASMAKKSKRHAQTTEQHTISDDPGARDLLIQDEVNFNHVRERVNTGAEGSHVGLRNRSKRCVTIM